MAIGGIGGANENPFLKKPEFDANSADVQGNDKINAAQESEGTDAVQRTGAEEGAASGNTNDNSSSLIDRSSFTDDNDLQEIDMEEFEDDFN